MIGAGARIVDSYVGPYTSIGRDVRGHRLRGRALDPARRRQRPRTCRRGSRRACSAATSSSRRGDGLPKTLRMIVGDTLGDHAPVRVLVDRRRRACSARDVRRRRSPPAATRSIGARPRRARHHRRAAESRTRSPSSGPTPSSTAPPGPTSTAPRPTSAAAMRGQRHRRRAARPAPRPRIGASVALPLQRLRLRRRQERALRRVRHARRRSRAYGRSKQAGETSVAIANPRHFIVRTSWLFGLGGHELRRDDAAPRRRAVRGARRHRPGRLPDLHAPTSPQALALLIETEELRHPPHRRRRAAAPGSTSRRRSSTRPGSRRRVMAATTEMLGRAGAAPAALGARPPSAATRSSCRGWQPGAAPSTSHERERAGRAR